MSISFRSEDYDGVQVQKIRNVLSTLEDAADSVEDADPTLSEIMLCMNDLLSGFLAGKRNADFNEEEWAKLDVKLSTTLQVIRNLLNEPTKTASNEIRPKQPGVSLPGSIYQMLFDESNRHMS
ncbi:MAG: hypothetical protein AAF497_00610 [Planctomycetota bacterium]